MIAQDVTTYRARCSALGAIMTDPKTKADKEAGVLGATCLSSVEQWVREHHFGRKWEFSSKQTNKGLMLESKAIRALNEHLGTDYRKDTGKIENEWLQGHRDIDGKTHVRDTKVIYGFQNMPIFATEAEKDYWWQLQGYLWLSGDKYQVAYVDKVFLTTPEIILNDLLLYAWNDVVKQRGFGSFALEEWYMEKANMILANHVAEWSDIELYTLFQPLKNLTLDYVQTAPDIPKAKRIKTFEIPRVDISAQVIERVQQIREHIKTIDL